MEPGGRYETIIDQKRRKVRWGGEWIYDANRGAGSTEEVSDFDVLGGGIGDVTSICDSRFVMSTIITGDFQLAIGVLGDGFKQEAYG